MPTLKQRKAFKELGVNGGIISKAMIKAGYTKEVAKRTDKLTKRKGWKELMDQFIPDKLLAQKHQELLNKKEVHKTFSHEMGEYVEEITEQPHSDVKGALDMAYKLKRRYGDEAHGDQNLTINLINLDSYGGNDSSLIQATVIPNTVPTEQKKIQDTDTAPKIGQEQDSVKLTDLQGLQ